MRSVGCDNAHDWDAWEEKVKIGIVSLTDREMVFDLVGVDVAFANALRRILIAEVRDAFIPAAAGAGDSRRQVPTMAIEKVYIQSNTSILQVLPRCTAQRPGYWNAFAVMTTRCVRTRSWRTDSA
jgi:DNA-directed RNA polymerase I and III subunit RPAC1